jgi:hypothetical protein
MSLKFNINRPKLSDDEINSKQDFDALVKQFKSQSLKKASGDESWWKNKKIQYSTVIAGITVICTITYFSIQQLKKDSKPKHETVITPKSSTSTTPSSKPFIAPPTSKLKVNYTTYTVSNQKGAQLTHSTKSKINIPKNSFVDKNGKTIVGDVTIQYREFHDVGDIIASGIPMAYDSLGKKYNLESAGMFDIKGTQNNEAVYINQDNTIKIEMASANSGNYFNQYYLDTIKRNWEYLKKDVALPLLSDNSNSSKSGANKNLAVPSKKIKDLEQLVQVILPKRKDSVGTVYQNKIQKLPTPVSPTKPVKANEKKPSFEIESDYKEYPELAVFDHVLFEVGSENKNYTPKLHEVTWNDLKISEGPQKGKNYLLTLIYRNRKEQLIVYPVLNESDFEKASKVYDTKLKTYESLLIKKQTEEKRLLAELESKQAAYLAEMKKKQLELEKERSKISLNANVLAQQNLERNFNNLSTTERARRVFEISRFGIFNSDCPRTIPNTEPIAPVFVTANSTKFLRADYVYLINHSVKQVYALDRDNGFKIQVSPNEEYSICVFKNKDIFVCEKQQFKLHLQQNQKKLIVTKLSENDNLMAFKKALEI